MPFIPRLKSLGFSGKYIKPDEQYEKQFIRKRAETKEEFEKLKAELEAQGFQVYGKEYLPEEGDKSGYFAMIWAEKRVPSNEEKLHLTDSAKAANAKEKKLNMGIKAFWWLLILIALLVYLALIRPLIRAIIAVIKK